MVALGALDSHLMEIDEKREQLVSAFMAHVQAVDGLAAKTAENYGLAARAFLRWWQREHPDRPLAAVRLADLMAHLVDEAQRGLATATRYGNVYGLKAFFRWLALTEQLGSDPAAGLRPPRQPAGRVDIYTPAEAAAILAAAGAASDLRGRQRHAVVAVFRYTGVRSAELRNLRVDSVDLKARRIEVVGKGGRSRLVPAPAPLVAVLGPFLTEVRPELPPSPFVFANPHPAATDPHRRLSSPALHDELQRAAKGAGVAGPHYPHKWRHTFATELVRCGVDIHTVQRLLGHRSIASTTIYTHLADDDLRSAVDGVFG